MRGLAVVCLVIAILGANAAVQRGKPSTRIVGGEDARVGQFPYATAIFVKTPTSTYSCGGALIDNQWILTSAQCVSGASTFTIQLGSNHLEGRDPNRVTLSTSNWVTHPDYNSTTLDNDIGLIKLHLPIIFTDYIKRVSLAGITNLGPGVSALGLGWGQTNDNHPGNSNILRYTTLTVLSNDECKLTFGSAITDKMVCVAGNYNEGTCTGDSGTPLVLQIGGLVWHVGISTFFSGNGCESTDPSGYTRTFPYVAWIRNVTQDNIDDITMTSY